jgi:hypothetical protein
MLGAASYSMNRRFDPRTAAGPRMESGETNGAGRQSNRAFRGLEKSTGRIGEGPSHRDEGVPGTRASANTSGPDFTAGVGPMKLRIVKDIRTERRKPVFFCRTGFERSLPRSDPTVDLMSRRHPLSSTEPSDIHPGLV